MTWRDHTWEFAVSGFSWLVAIGAIIFVVAYLAHDALRTRSRRRRRSS